MNARHNPLSILLCEDDELSLILLSRMISICYPDSLVYCASNGETGLEMFKEHAPNLVITDIQMPLIEGVQMCHEMQGIKPEIKTIVVTAHGEQTIHDLTAKMPIRIDHYFLKPLSYECLFDAIEDCAGWRGAQTT